MISGILVLNTKGEIVISRYYRDDVSRTTADSFRTNIIAAQKTGTPVVNIDKTSFFYYRYSDLYFVAITTLNANATLVFQFLYKLVDVFRAFFNQNTINEEMMKNNFVLIYELFDEVLDFGWPQMTAVSLLSSLIKHGQAKGEASDEKSLAADSGITSEITGSVDWRQPGKKYRKNEAFIDVIESINLLLSSQGQILRCDVSGRVLMKTYLSGMPECKFGLNDRFVLEAEAKKNPNQNKRASAGIMMDDVTFHRCVKLTSYERERVISFVPPDGEFELMKYRCSSNIQLPFTVTPVITQHGSTRLEYEIKIKANFPEKMYASHVIIKIPTPPLVSKTTINLASSASAASSSTSSVAGKAKYKQQEKAIIWKIPRMNGGQSFTLQSEVKCLSTMTDSNAATTWSRPPITLDFQVPMFAASGLHVRFLKIIEKSGYDTVKWVRYMTRAGQYQIRI